MDEVPNSVDRVKSEEIIRDRADNSEALYVVPKVAVTTGKYRDSYVTNESNTDGFVMSNQM